MGIDQYPSTPLRGCVNDARAISTLLSRHADDSPNFDVQTLASPPDSITRTSLLHGIERLFTHDEADVALLYFSGHGTENDFGGFLVTPDATKYSEGVNLTDILTFANNSKARERVIILDSCMSGAFGAVPAVNSNSANLAEGVSVLTASRSGQVSLEANGRGVFSELVCSALEGGAADVIGSVSAASIYTYVEEALGPWEQRPLFKAHLSKMVSLRSVPAAVPLGVLRQLPEWFPDKTSEYALNPTYEYTDLSANLENVSIFKKLQQCRDAKLVEAVDADYLYFAAMESKSCRLTMLGQHYWQRSKDGRI